MRRRASPALLLALVLGLGACAPAVVVPRPGTGPYAPPGRMLLLAREGDVLNRGIATRAAELVAQGLRPAGEVWSPEELLREASVAGGLPWALPMLARLRQGGWPTEDERIELLRFAVTGVIVTEITTYDQVWGRYAKFTRVGVEVRGFDVAAGGIAWRLHRTVEVEDVRGRAFEYAVEQAVAQVLAAIAPGTAYSMVGLWRVWRR